MKRWQLVTVCLTALLGAVGCSNGLKEPIPFESSTPLLDLRTWNFQFDSPVIPQGWSWDANVLWSPAQGGRPAELAPPRLLGPPDRGGSLADSLMEKFPSLAAKPLVSATARLTILTSEDQDLGLQIGALPGAFRVWVNGIQVWEQGVVSTDPSLYRAGGVGTTLSVQPRDGVLDIVANIVTSDPLIRHSELNRRWVVGPAVQMMQASQAENNWRSLQSAVLIMGILIFLWIATLRSERRPLFLFVGFLGVCLLKLYANVEQTDPLLNTVFPGVSPSVSLFLNHGFNLLPFPFFLLFLMSQFPKTISIRSTVVFLVLTALVAVWELLPFVALALGWEQVYEGILHTWWYFLLNFYVVVATLYLFERLYQVFTRRLPLSRALFLGGIFMGLIVLLPVPLSYFVAVKYTYFLGWGMFVFLGILTFEVVRLQLGTVEAELKTLRDRLFQRESLAKFLAPDWAPRLGKDSLESLRPGDSRAAESVVVQIRSSGDPSAWLPVLGPVATLRHAILVEWREGTGTWVLSSWSETALAFALEAQKQLLGVPGLPFRIVLARAVVRYVILDLESHWLPSVSELPFARLEELHGKADKMGATLVLDGTLREGLAIGGWRRHRALSVAGTEMELYEAEEETLALLKDRTLDSYESALGLARVGDWEPAVQTLFSVVQENPFDVAARTLLSEWGTLRRS